MSMDPQELAERLLQRCAPQLEGVQRTLLEDSLRNDTPDALIDLLFLSARNDVLRSDEVEAGLELAHSGIFRQSGPGVIAALTDYQRVQSAQLAP